MLRLLSLLSITASILASGCAICSTPYDCHYSAYGGSNPRVDRVNGRVGSAFRDAGAGAAPQAFSSEIVEGEVIIDDGMIEGEIIQDGMIEGEVLQDEVIEGDIVQGNVIDGMSDPNVVYGTPGSDAPIIELPTMNDDAAVPTAPQLELPNILNETIENVISPNVGAPAAPTELPFGSPTPLPATTAPVKSLPDLDRMFDGLPPSRHDATIEVLPSVIESSIR